VRAEQHGEPIYPCPICLTPFTVDALADGRLSSEHVPPESVGGHELVLTCKRCNNSAGTKLDADAAVKELVRSAMAGTRQHRERVKAAIGDLRVNAEVTDLQWRGPCAITVETQKTGAGSCPSTPTLPATVPLDYGSYCSHTSPAHPFV
jgi:HNH endonuclease